MLEELSTAVMLEDQAMTLLYSICKASLTAQSVVPIAVEKIDAVQSCCKRHWGRTTLRPMA